eukprot:GHVS01099585.1.p1 GENE.GHVS01099585.1~~GHVS01099585.1.p1  ORF type:complete len:2028 (-),score=280.89 GHVS01099585.1:86-6043(-)
MDDKASNTVKLSSSQAASKDNPPTASSQEDPKASKSVHATSSVSSAPVISQSGSGSSTTQKFEIRNLAAVLALKKGVFSPFLVDIADQKNEVGRNGDEVECLVGAMLALKAGDVFLGGLIDGAVDLDTDKIDNELKALKTVQVNVEQNVEGGLLFQAELRNADDKDEPQQTLWLLSDGGTTLKALVTALPAKGSLSMTSLKSVADSTGDGVEFKLEANQKFNIDEETPFASETVLDGFKAKNKTKTKVVVDDLLAGVNQALTDATTKVTDANTQAATNAFPEAADKDITMNLTEDEIKNLAGGLAGFEKLSGQAISNQPLLDQFQKIKAGIVGYTTYLTEADSFKKAELAFERGKAKKIVEDEITTAEVTKASIKQAETTNTATLTDTTDSLNILKEISAAVPVEVLILFKTSPTIQIWGKGLYPVPVETKRLTGDEAAVYKDYEFMTYFSFAKGYKIEMLDDKKIIIDESTFSTVLAKGGVFTYNLTGGKHLLTVLENDVGKVIGVYNNIVDTDMVSMLNSPTASDGGKAAYDEITFRANNKGKSAIPVINVFFNKVKGTFENEQNDLRLIQSMAVKANASDFSELDKAIKNARESVAAFDVNSKAAGVKPTMPNMQDLHVEDFVKFVNVVKNWLLTVDGTNKESRETRWDVQTKRKDKWDNLEKALTTERTLIDRDVTILVAEIEKYNQASSDGSWVVQGLSERKGNDSKLFSGGLSEHDITTLNGQYKKFLVWTTALKTVVVSDDSKKQAQAMQSNVKQSKKKSVKVPDQRRLAGLGGGGKRKLAGLTSEQTTKMESVAIIVVKTADTAHAVSVFWGKWAAQAGVYISPTAAPNGLFTNVAKVVPEDDAELDVMITYNGNLWNLGDTAIKRGEVLVCQGSTALCAKANASDAADVFLEVEASLDKVGSVRLGNGRVQTEYTLCVPVKPSTATSYEMLYSNNNNAVTKPMLPVGPKRALFTLASTVGFEEDYKVLQIKQLNNISFDFKIVDNLGNDVVKGTVPFVTSIDLNSTDSVVVYSEHGVESIPKSLLIADVADNIGVTVASGGTQLDQSDTSFKAISNLGVMTGNDVFNGLPLLTAEGGALFAKTNALDSDSSRKIVLFSSPDDLDNVDVTVAGKITQNVVFDNDPFKNAYVGVRSVTLIGDQLLGNLSDIDKIQFASSFGTTNITGANQKKAVEVGLILRDNLTRENAGPLAYVGTAFSVDNQAPLTRSLTVLVGPDAGIGGVQCGDFIKNTLGNLVSRLPQVYCNTTVLPGTVKGSLKLGRGVYIASAGPMDTANVRALEFDAAGMILAQNVSGTKAIKVVDQTGKYAYMTDDQRFVGVQVAKPFVAGDPDVLQCLGAVLNVTFKFPQGLDGKIKFWNTASANWVEIAKGNASDLYSQAAIAVRPAETIMIDGGSSLSNVKFGVNLEGPVAAVAATAQKVHGSALVICPVTRMDADIVRIVADEQNRTVLGVFKVDKIKHFTLAANALSNSLWQHDDKGKEKIADTLIGWATSGVKSGAKSVSEYFGAFSEDPISAKKAIIALMATIGDFDLLTWSTSLDTSIFSVLKKEKNFVDKIYVDGALKKVPALKTNCDAATALLVADEYLTAICKPSSDSTALQTARSTQAKLYDLLNTGTVQGKLDASSLSVENVFGVERLRFLADKGSKQFANIKKIVLAAKKEVEKSLKKKISVADVMKMQSVMDTATKQVEDFIKTIDQDDVEAYIKQLLKEWEDQSSNVESFVQTGGDFDAYNKNVEQFYKHIASAETGTMTLADAASLPRASEMEQELLQQRAILKATLPPPAPVKQKTSTFSKGKVTFAKLTFEVKEAVAPAARRLAAVNRLDWRKYSTAMCVAWNRTNSSVACVHDSNDKKNRKFNINLIPKNKTVTTDDLDVAEQKVKESAASSADMVKTIKEAVSNGDDVKEDSLLPVVFVGSKRDTMTEADAAKKTKTIKSDKAKTMHSLSTNGAGRVAGGPITVMSMVFGLVGLIFVL